MLTLDDQIAFSMLNVSHIDGCVEFDSYAGVFMSILLFPLTAVFGNTTNIVNFRACLFASLHLNHYYIKYCDDHAAYDPNIHRIGDNK